MNPPHAPGPVQPSRALGLLDRALDLLLPLTLLGGLLFAPEWLVQRGMEQRLRRGARVLRGRHVTVEPHGFLIVARANAEPLSMNMRGTRRVSWMVLPRVWGIRRATRDLVRFEGPEGTFLVEEPPAGLTRLLAAVGARVDRLSYGREAELAALLTWWAALALGAWQWVPWDLVVEAWRGLW